MRGRGEQDLWKLRLAHVQGKGRFAATDGVREHAADGGEGLLFPLTFNI